MPSKPKSAESSRSSKKSSPRKSGRPAGAKKVAPSRARSREIAASPAPKERAAKKAAPKKRAPKSSPPKKGAEVIEDAIKGEGGAAGITPVETTPQLAYARVGDAPPEISDIVAEHRALCAEVRELHDAATEHALMRDDPVAKFVRAKLQRDRQNNHAVFDDPEKASKDITLARGANIYIDRLLIWLSLGANKEDASQALDKLTAYEEENELLLQGEPLMTRDAGKVAKKASQEPLPFDVEDPPDGGPLPDDPKDVIDIDAGAIDKASVPMSKESQAEAERLMRESDDPKDVIEDPPVSLRNLMPGYHQLDSRLPFLLGLALRRRAIKLDKLATFNTAIAQWRKSGIVDVELAECLEGWWPKDKIRVADKKLCEGAHAIVRRDPKVGVLIFEFHKHAAGDGTAQMVITYTLGAGVGCEPLLPLIRICEDIPTPELIAELEAEWEVDHP